MRRILVILAVAFVALFAALIGSAILRSNGPVAVAESTVTSARFRITLPETGVIQLPELVTVPAQIAGTLGALHVRAGDHVTRGEVLATITNPTILANLSDAEAVVRSAGARASSVAETNSALPSQNRSTVVQAQAGVVTARATLVQARQDLVAGAQSGLGYGGQTAEEQRVLADANLSRSDTDLREAKRLFDADRYLYDQKAVSHDTLDQAQAKYDEMRVADDQARQQRRILGGTLEREDSVLHDRVHAAENGLAQALAALDSAKAAAAETRSGDLEAANSDAGKARSDLDFARDQADRLDIRAPIDGTVQSVATETGDTLRPLQSGDPVTEGLGVVTLAAPGGFIVRTRVDEQDIASISVGQRATVSGEDFAGATLPGHVVAISPIAQRSDDPSNTSRQVLTTIALDRRLPFLRDGMTVDVDIVTLEMPDAVSVPLDALRRDGADAYVYRDDHGAVARVAVRTGPQNDTRVVVKSGLAAGDVVIADKSRDFKDGARVKPAPSATPATS